MKTTTAVSVPPLAVINGRPVTSSLNVADFFGKQHRVVLKSISQLKIEAADSAGFSEHNFVLTSYIDAQGKPRPMYNLSRDGFTLLAMGFTGKEALQFKIAYIEAFNRMETELLSLAADGSRKVVDVNHSFFRKTPSPSGLDIRYNLDLTKIILRPTKRSLALLERLTGIAILDLEELADTASGQEVSNDDLARDFIAACLVVADETSPREITDSRIRVSTLYESFREWYRQTVDSRLVGLPTMRGLNQHLYRLGLTGRRVGGQCWIYGVMLKSTFDGGTGRGEVR